MKTKPWLIAILVLALVLTWVIGSAKAQQAPDTPNAPGTAFTYQGQLVKDGSPYNGACNFTFVLWDAAANGAPVGAAEDKSGTSVANGVFTVQLNETGQFGANAFNGSPRWLQIGVKCSGDTNLTDLGRQPLTVTPYASYAVSAGSAANGVVTTGSYADPTWLTSLSAGKLSGVLAIAKGGTGSAAQNFVDLTTGQIVGGVKTFSSTAGFSQASGAPFTVASSSLVTHLNADLLDGYHAASLQGLRRALPPKDNLLTTLDNTSNAGMFSSITIGSDGLPVISYWGWMSADLAVAHCADLACTSAELHTISTAEDDGPYTSIAVGSDGLPVISYYDQSDTDLRVAHCADVACSSAVVHTPDSTGHVSGFTSIMIGNDGLPVISYYDGINTDLKVAHCADLVCSTAAIHTLDSLGDVGMGTSIALGGDGLPVIGYYDLTNADLKVAHCGDPSCSSADIHIVDGAGDTGKDPSITIGSDGLPVISYYDMSPNFDLKVAHCADPACTSADLHTLDGPGLVGRYSSITIGGDDLPVISYFDEDNADLKVAHCTDPACSSATVYTPDSAGYVGEYTSITIGSDGLPIISYSSGYLKAAHCSSPLCVPYQKRR